MAPGFAGCLSNYRSVWWGLRDSLDLGECPVKEGLMRKSKQQRTSTDRFQQQQSRWKTFSTSLWDLICKAVCTYTSCLQTLSSSRCVFNNLWGQSTSTVWARLQKPFWVVATLGRGQKRKHQKRWRTSIPSILSRFMHPPSNLSWEPNLHNWKFMVQLFIYVLPYKIFGTALPFFCKLVQQQLQNIPSSRSKLFQPIWGFCFTVHEPFSCLDCDCGRCDGKLTQEKRKSVGNS